MKEYKPKILIKHITKATRESPTCREAEGIALKIINEFVYGICFAYSLINCNFKNYDLNMRFLYGIVLFFIIVPNYKCWTQRGYNLKKEYGYKGNIKKVTTYMVNVGRYQIPVDTLNYYGKSTMDFSNNGDLQEYNQLFDLPNYYFISKANYKGKGKQVSFIEKTVLNGAEEKVTEYQFKWLDDLHYKIVALNGEGIREVVLNTDFTVKRVDFEWDSYKSVETAKYTYIDNALEQVVYERIAEENGETSITMDVRKVQSIDVYKNPTVIYVYKSEDSRVPTSVLFRYYEYY